MTRSPKNHGIRSAARGRPRARRAGFTLIELLVALAAGLLVITSVYFLSAASSRHFHEQQRIAQTQMSLRMAMAQVRTDVERAGFLGTPNSDYDQGCRKPIPPIRAIDTYVNNDATATGWLPNHAQNGVSADTLVLTGNYVTNDTYLAVGLDGTGATLYLQRRWQAFRRTFGDPFDTTGKYPYRPSDFDNVFRSGRMLHIRTQQGNNFFVTITGSDSGQATVSFTPALGVGGTCVVGLADGALVSPMTRIQYTVSNLTRDGSGAGANLAPVGGAATASDFKGRTDPMLVRSELQFNSTTAVAGTIRPVLEYVADFNLEFVVDTQLTAGAAPILTRMDGATAQTLLATHPERVRSVIVSLSARTAEQDPRFPWAARAAGTPLTRYRVNPALAGAARVRTITDEILLPNVANRAIRTP